MSRATLDWSFGLKSADGKYLTAEIFQYKIVASASKMKQKQIFHLEQSDGADSSVYIRSHLNHYLTVNGDGKFTGDSEEKGEEQAFIIEAQDDGRWLLKSAKYGWYAGGSGESLTAFTKSKDADRFWTVQLAMHPQVCIKNKMRKTYVHYSEGRSGAQMSTDEIIPWGFDATVSISFHDAFGAYSLQAFDGTYLSPSGELVPEFSKDVCYVIEFDGGFISFKSLTTGKYITALGSQGLCKATKSSITADEQFVLEDSYPQITMRADSKDLVSKKQGVEIGATFGDDEPTDNEIFQLEPSGNGTWIIKVNNSPDPNPTIWETMADGSIHCTGAATPAAEAEPQCLFEVEFLGTQIAIKSVSNGKYVSQAMNKYLKAKADAVDDKCKFVFEIINRPQLVLRGSYGFIGTLPSGLLQCGFATPTAYGMEMTGGEVKLSSGSGAEKKYWKIEGVDSTISVKGPTPEIYAIELWENSKMTLKSTDTGKYFEGSQNGTFAATGTEVKANTLWEY
jgi:fascin 1/2